MKIGKLLCSKYNINTMQRLGKNLIKVEFEEYLEANAFVENKNLLPPDLSVYIPNYRIFRTGVIRNVDASLSCEEILDGISWPKGSVKILSLERMKYKDKTSDEIKDSLSIKATFASNLLPEFVYIWRVKCRVFPFVNKVRNCANCHRWGHSVAACRGESLCAGCGVSHPATEPCTTTPCCINCRGNHASSDPSCLSYTSHLIINTVMAYTNSSFSQAKRLVRSRGLESCQQAINELKSQAYYAWIKVVPNSIVEGIRSYRRSKRSNRSPTAEPEQPGAATSSRKPTITEQRVLTTPVVKVTKTPAKRLRMEDGASTNRSRGPMDLAPLDRTWKKENITKTVNKDI
ncbi:uncharacterized protein [Temnothorax nylanderi]|uniref:uncharacterized protein n=1 Tax=Temnothorax nylanderi TaxID=102681 RepID=UPI003A8BE918